MQTTAVLVSWKTRGVRHLLLAALLMMGPVPGSWGFGIQSGGQSSIDRADQNAFSLASPALSLQQRHDFYSGSDLFRSPWVIAPASNRSRDGLGPLSNANGCRDCHTLDGRGHLPTHPDDNNVSLLLRVSLRPETDVQWQQVREQGVIPHPQYGAQIQDFANPGLVPEAHYRLRYETTHVTLADGEVVTLSRPLPEWVETAYGEPAANVNWSLRLAPAIVGLGLLDILDDEQIAAFADPDDRDGDGISGRPNRVRQAGSDGLVNGRYGWKAEQPSLRQQNAAAFLGDLGITSPLFPEENCTPAATQCRQAPTGGSPELSDTQLNQITFYTANLAVPQRRNVRDPQVKQGEALFTEAGCAGCHRVAFVTPKVVRQPQLSGQTIHPYTDLLLHDMGEGLADHRPVFSASGSEWRTPPLWGIGLTATVTGQEHYLHDGRARNLLEAILWHDGEARASKAFVVSASREQRAALVAFLQSL